MKNILVIGAGRCATHLIQYLLEHASRNGWFITVADLIPERALGAVNGHIMGRGTWLDVSKINDRRDLIERADLVITSLPAHLHLEIAHDCIRLKKKLITNGTVTHELYRLGDEGRDRDLTYTGQMGLDPALHHLMGKKLLDEIRQKGGKVLSYKCYTGALMHPDSCSQNPWKYKFTWNPRNTVLMGQGTGQYLEQNKPVFIPYHRLFQEFETVKITGLGSFEAFTDRDGMVKRDIYGLGDVPNIRRYTLRPTGFCEAWNALILLGLTDGDYPLLGIDQLTFHAFTDGIVSANQSAPTLKERLAAYLGISATGPVVRKLDWLGLFSKSKVGIDQATPALLLEHMLRKKWTPDPADKDLAIIRIEIAYTYKHAKHTVTATLSASGDHIRDSGISKIIGWPVAALAKMVLNGQVKSLGYDVPMQPEVYQPILEECKAMGLSFELQHSGGG